MYQTVAVPKGPDTIKKLKNQTKKRSTPVYGVAGKADVVSAIDLACAILHPDFPECLLCAAEARQAQQEHSSLEQIFLSVSI